MGIGRWLGGRAARVGKGWVIVGQRVAPGLGAPGLDSRGKVCFRRKGWPARRCGQEFPSKGSQPLADEGGGAGGCWEVHGYPRSHLHRWLPVGMTG